MQAFISLLLMALVLFPVTSAAETLWRDPVTAMEFVHLPGGCYPMGATQAALGANPVHQVCVGGFWLARYETNNDQYRRCVLAGSCPAPEQQDVGIKEHFRTGDEDHYQQMGEALTAGDHPVVGVSWLNAQMFAKWLSSQTGEKFRLPTEAEWEYGCRADRLQEPTHSQSEMKITAWYSQNSQGKSHASGSKMPNNFGLYDMSGNVWEWVEDHFDSQAYTQHAKNSPLFVKKDFFHVNRGGSWSSEPIHLNCAYRGVGEEQDRDDNLGFRLVREE